MRVSLIDSATNRHELYTSMNYEWWGVFIKQVVQELSRAYINRFIESTYWVFEWQNKTASIEKGLTQGQLWFETCKQTFSALKKFVNFMNIRRRKMHIARKRIKDKVVGGGRPFSLQWHFGQGHIKQVRSNSINSSFKDEIPHPKWNRVWKMNARSWPVIVTQ
jgi:hypothetical protein